MFIKFLSMLFQAPKNNIIELDDNMLLVPEIPFYGIAGTIYRIEEAPETYYKVLYNQDGSINPTKIPVPKKKSKNLSLLLNDYINDVEKYIEVYKKECTEYTNVNPILKKKEFYILLIITILATIASIPFLFITVNIGLIFSSVSVLSMCILIDIRKRDIEIEGKNNNFVTQYRVLEELLQDHQSGKLIIKIIKQKEMFYKKESNKRRVSIFKKILTTNNYREVA